MLSGSVVGDGNYALLQELFAARGSLTFSGTLTQDDLERAVQYVIDRPTPEPVEAVVEARQALGWTGEQLGCAATRCSIPELEMRDEHMLAALDVDESSGAVRLLMFSVARPELGRVICLLDPRETPPTLVGRDEEAFASGGVPCIRAALVATQAMAPPAAANASRSDQAATSEPPTRPPSSAAVTSTVDHHPPLGVPSPPAPPASSGEALAVFEGVQNHPMFGDLPASLRLTERLAVEPKEAEACHAVAWPPKPSEPEEGEPEPPPCHTSWWRGRWKVDEFKVDEEVLVGVYSSEGASVAALVLVAPGRSGPKCELASWDAPGRLRGGNQHWTPAKRPAWTLTQVPGGAHTASIVSHHGAVANLD